MIPLRVYLKNFLCHAEQEFLFDGHPVWLLCGPNGVGKSAVFDAMVYALFAESRRSDSRKNAVADVIRHGRSSMRVEFDFELCGQRYQVWRTRARSGQPKQGANQWIDGAWRPVRDVNSARDLDGWVVRALGLTYDVFVSAVLLRQGAAEKLIDADKDARRELFRSFMDLDPYIQLCTRVTEARAELSAGVRHLRALLIEMAEATDAEIDEAAEAERGCAEALQLARDTENAARDRLGHARVWEGLDAARRRIRGELDAAAYRARRADELQRQVGRLRLLEALVPGLTSVRDLTAGLTNAEQVLTERTGEQATATARNEGLLREIDDWRRLIDTYRGQVEDLDRQIASADSNRQRLADDIGRADQAAELHRKLGQLMAKQFDPGLDDQIDAAQSAVDEAQAAKEALAHLDALVTRRSEYRTAIADERTAEGELASVLKDLERLVPAEEAARAEAERVARSKGQAEQNAAVASNQYGKAVERRDRFAATATEPICSECGQRISPVHAADHRAKLEQAVTDAAALLHDCRETVDTANAAVIAASERLGQAESDRRGAEARRDSATRLRDDARRRAANANAAFEREIGFVGDAYAPRVAPIDADGFPTEGDVVAACATARELAARIRRRDDLLKQQRDRDQTQRDIQTLEGSVAAVGAPRDVTTARHALARIDEDLAGLRGKRAAAAKARDDAVQSEREATSAQHQLATRLTTLAGETTRAEGEVDSVRRALDAAIAALPEAHRQSAPSVSPEQLQALADELAGLRDSRVEEQLNALSEDRALQAERERQLSEVERQIGAVPEDARRPAAEVERGVATAESATRQAELLHDEARTRVRTLAGQRDQRRETERQLGEAERNHTLHDRLVGLLGPDGIQLDLVRGAEHRIIARANETLMRLSGGGLRFEPPDPESPRSFELSVRRLGCPEPIAVGNLSGGERFRVAVSLALAVCHGLEDPVRRLESVIIDEGFGSLDREGRAALVAELRDGPTLSGMFRRIIVVSHQDDFASAFPVGYRLRSEDGTTRAERFRAT